MTARKVNDIQLIVLAAGKGTRMNSDLPKVLTPLDGKPLVAHLLAHVGAVGFTHKPVIIVGHRAELVRQALGPEYRYVVQSEQRGTGHAVKCAQPPLEGKVEDIMVLYGDHPLIDAETIRTIGSAHLASHKPLTMATVSVDDFSDWRNGFWHWGRIIRDGAGAIIRNVEFKDANETERAITEVNPSFFCFKAEWLWENLAKLTDHNHQKEYYLPDLIQAARESGGITDVAISPRTALGANTKEELAVLEAILREQS